MPCTATTCGSIISWTPMKLGPTTFQWMCLSMRPVSIRAYSRSCSDSRIVSTSVSARPGTVKLDMIVRSLGCGVCVGPLRTPVRGGAYRLVRCPSAGTGYRRAPARGYRSAWLSRT